MTEHPIYARQQVGFESCKLQRKIKQSPYPGDAHLLILKMDRQLESHSEHDAIKGRATSSGSGEGIPGRGRCTGNIFDLENCSSSTAARAGLLKLAYAYKSPADLGEMWMP